MRTPTLPVLSLALLCLPACTINRHQGIVGEPSYQLARRDHPDGSSEIFRLETSVASGDAWLQVHTNRDRERPFFGLKVRELDKPEAERRGVKPYSGLLVTGTYPKSAAEESGVRSGDVILSIDGKETVYEHQVPEIETVIRPGQVVTAQVLRGQSQVELAVTTKPLAEKVTDRESVPLIRPPAVQTLYAGMSVRGIPRVWTERVFGTSREAVVITNVEVGGPAWLAGFRGGDLIDSVDGGPPLAVADLSGLIVERGSRGEPLSLSVSRGGANVHSAGIDLHDYSGTTEVYVPLVFRVEDGVTEERWSILPFGILAGGRSRYVTDQTRQPQSETTFSALLGLFRTHTGPGGSELRLLWFIKINT